MKEISLGYTMANVYFAIDADTLELLNTLTKDEIENFDMCVRVHPDTEYVQYTFGHAFHKSEHLEQFGNGIDNTTWIDDDFNGVMQWAKENKIEWDEI